MRLNGFRLDNTTHEEFVQFLNRQGRVTMKVRHMRLLPVKEYVFLKLLLISQYSPKHIVNYNR